MRPSIFHTIGMIAVFLAAPAPAQMTIPTDAAKTCVVDGKTFNSWFSGGAPTANGPVNPASSVTFTSDHPNNGSGPNVCNFYQWGAQMFLWLTSPEGDGLVLDGPSVFTVTPENVLGKRHMIPNTTGANYSLALRSAKVDDIGEVGQAGSNGVLVSQTGELVYYGIHVNDVYGYFLSGQMTGGIKGVTDFPHNASDLKTVVNYAQSAYGAKMATPQTLAIEMKTSWVDAAAVPVPASYVTIEAKVPVYTANSTNTEWKPSGPATKKLALTGIHIVGTVQDHPEFVWATFEHISNAPDANYFYTNNVGKTVEQRFSSAGKFLFMATGGSQEGANVECAKEAKDGSIKAAVTPPDGSMACAGGIVPSNTVRSYPWGSPKNNQTAAVLENNTFLLAINESVRSQLSSGDVRKNYVQMGGIWTTTPQSRPPIPNQNLYLRGSLKLFNATMETYTQGTSCFSCHKLDPGAPNSFGAYMLSHIYSTIEPLPKK